MEKFVATPELYSENSIGTDPLPPGQAWVISPGGGDENPGLYQVDVTEGPGGGVKILNQPAPPPFKESVRCAEQNLYVRAKELVGDRDPRQHEFSVQLRAFDSAKSGSGVGVGVLLALCSSLLQKSIKGGLAVTGGLNLGGSIETIFNPVAVVEIGDREGRRQHLDADQQPATAERPARRSGGQGHDPLLPRCSRCLAEGVGNLIATRLMVLSRSPRQAGPRMPWAISLVP